jgi:hypothetical protein
MIQQFEIFCKACGAHGFCDSENNGTIKVLFEKGTPSTMDRAIIYCSKCGSKQESGIYWPLDTKAILTRAMHSDGEGSGENEVCNRYREAGYCQCSQY